MDTGAIGKLEYGYGHDRRCNSEELQRIRRTSRERPVARQIVPRFVQHPPNIDTERTKFLAEWPISEQVANAFDPRAREHAEFLEKSILAPNLNTNVKEKLCFPQRFTNKKNYLNYLNVI